MRGRCLAIGVALAAALGDAAPRVFTDSRDAAVAPSQDYGLLPSSPDSDEGWAPINTLKQQAPQLSRVFAQHVCVSRSGERMPYRLFTPARLEPGHTYPLVVFLHGAGGSVIEYGGRFSSCTGRASWHMLIAGAVFLVISRARWQWWSARLPP